MCVTLAMEVSTAPGIRPEEPGVLAWAHCACLCM